MNVMDIVATPLNRDTGKNRCLKSEHEPSKT